jgi:hydrogenase expression/formation protein HypC
MCLGIPGEILEVDGNEARAEFRGAEKRVRVDMVAADLEVGDYVLNHAGFAIRKIPERQVERTVELYEEAARRGPEGQTAPAADRGHGAGHSGADTATGEASHDS